MELKKLPQIPYGSLFFAPMEGITDEAFRKTIIKLYPEWDYLATDFLRVPSAGRYPKKHIIRHFGLELVEKSWVLDRTMFQILTSHRAFTIDMVKQIEDLKFPWLDMNIGCPSNTVCKNQGGSFLLTNLISLRNLVKNIREHFSGRFSCKIRIGYNNTDNFEDSIKMLNDEGVELITVHARTRDDMYKMPARWSFIEKAVKISQVPIIGNGDVWTPLDLQNMLEQTGCHGVMVARGALKAPWMARCFKENNFRMSDSEIYNEIKIFLKNFRQNLEEENITPRGLLKQSKSVSRFMLDGLEETNQIRRKLVLSQTVSEFYSIIENL